MQLELPLYPNHQTWQEEIPHLVRWFERTFHWYETFPLNTSNHCFKTSIPMVHLPINKHQSSRLSHCPTKISVTDLTDARKKMAKKWPQIRVPHHLQQRGVGGSPAVAASARTQGLGQGGDPARMTGDDRLKSWVIWGGFHIYIYILLYLTYDSYMINIWLIMVANC